MLDQKNVSAYVDDEMGSESRRVRYGVVNVVAAITAVGTLMVMVFGPGACARPARYLFSWLVLLVSTLVAVAPLVDLLPEECFDDEEEEE
ncbi:hypothetical protein [Bifidobacterium castoris]|uniref:Uncharacterized protein n=1 Tax=Bifidobacterium castoris TaxID=2306972 RepID=A0A430F4C3_9BIFI|nr:hypothetical protein [Bifidobacterium castoris]RSX44652.1 hypothetical protein D2E22_1938 [Bifidobacterium castoris]